MTDIRIYITAHKDSDFDYPMGSNIYIPMEVGAALHESHFFDIRDDSGDNISLWNGVYSELTGLYWIWRQIDKQKGLNQSHPKGLSQSHPKGLKQSHPKGLKQSHPKGLNTEGAEGLNDFYVGHCQYRRRLEFSEDTDFDEIFKKHDMISAVPYKFPYSVKQQYSNCHNVEDIELVEDIVKFLYPDYAEDWNKYINEGQILFYSQGFIMKKNDFIDYCRWLFSIFDEFKKRRNWNTPEDVRAYVSANRGYRNKRNSDVGYQMLIFGFLAERLMSLYVRHNFKSPMLVEYRKYGNA